MNHRGLDVRAVAYQAIKQVDGFEDTASNKVAEQQDIHVTHMMIGDSPKTSIANMLLCEQILLRQPPDLTGAFYDLHMQVLNGGRERTENEFRLLLQKEGLKLNVV